MEKYRREGRVVRLQTGLGATVHRAVAGGCWGILPAASPRVGELPGAGAAAFPRGGGRGLCSPQPSCHRFWGTGGIQDLHMG